MSRNAWWMLAGLCLVAVLGVQFNQLNKLKREVASILAEISATPPKDQEALAPGAADRDAQPALPPETTGLQSRLAHLERNVAALSKASEALMEHGFLPPSEDQLAQLQQKFFDPNTPESDRLQALRLLRLKNQLSDEVIAQSLNMLQTSTNANFRRELLQHLNGATNAALKQPLLAMLETESADNGLRGQLANILRRFVDDPVVESKMWDLALNDPVARIRDQAREAVARGPATPERLDQLRAKAENPEASLDERLISFRALRLVKSHTPELVNDLAALAQQSTDPVARAKLFKSFNGLTDESLLAPLVDGLQDADPVVRQNAADSLSSFPDPRVQEWLTHLIQNDADPTVKREAHAALEHSQRLSRPGK